MISARRSVQNLLLPRLQGVRNTFHRRKGERYRAFFVGGLAAFCWGLIFSGTWRVLRYLEDAPQVGDLVAKNILSILVLTLLSLLAYSSIISALSTFFLSKDLELLFPAPVPIVSIFRAKYLETLAASSWMVFVFMTPVVVCYGIRLQAPAWFYPSAFLAWVVFCTIPVSAGVAVVFVLINVFPARRLRDVLMVFFVVIAAVFIYLARYLRPERLTNPEARASIQEYVSSLELAGSSLSPATWLTELLAYGTKLPVAGGPAWLGLYALALPVVALALYFLAEALSLKVYFRGWSLTQESKRVDPEGRTGPVMIGHRQELVDQSEFIRIIPDRLRRVLDRIVVAAARILSLFAPRKAKPVLEKDLLTFFRDTSQWSQLLIIGAIVAVYLLNIWALNLQKGVDIPSVRGTVSFLNLGMVAFVLTSIVMRFAFPAVSIEGEAFWILRTASMPARAIVAAKFWTYFPPLLLLAELLVIGSNHLLQVPSYLLWMGPLAVAFFAFSLTAMGVGLGAVYPNFRAENVSQVSLSYGGIVFMLSGLSLTAVNLMLLAGPAYLFSISEFRRRPLTSGELVLSFAAVLLSVAILAVTGWHSLRRGVRALDALGRD